MQKETREKLRSLPGGAIGNFVSVDSAKCATAVLPFSWVVAWWIKHLDPCSERRQNHGWRAKGFMNIDPELVFPS